MYTHVYCSHAFPLLWYVCCSWYVQYGLILFLTLITCKNMFKILTISLSLKQKKKTTKNYQLPKYKSFKENYFETLNSNDDDLIIQSKNYLYINHISQIVHYHPSKRYWNPIRQYFKIINTRHTTVSTVLNKNKRHFILRF